MLEVGMREYHDTKHWLDKFCFFEVHCDVSASKWAYFITQKLNQSKGSIIVRMTKRNAQSPFNQPT